MKVYYAQQILKEIEIDDMPNHMLEEYQNEAKEHRHSTHLARLASEQDRAPIETIAVAIAMHQTMLCQWVDRL